MLAGVKATDLRKAESLPMVLLLNHASRLLSQDTTTASSTSLGFETRLTTFLRGGSQGKDEHS